MMIEEKLDLGNAKLSYSESAEDMNSLFPTSNQFFPWAKFDEIEDIQVKDM